MQSVIAQTKAWVEFVVVKSNFCPFAHREVERDSIRYSVLENAGLETALHALVDECVRLASDENIETTLLILPDGFDDFDGFLDLVAMAENLVVDQGFDGVFQIASFHPDYCFADSAQDDPANYTNRAPYPTLHLIREASIARALETFPEPESIPERNVQYARKRGLAAMQAMLDTCKSVKR